MAEFRFEKLVRDNIVANIIASGGKVNYRSLNDEEFLEESKKKLAEEVAEVQVAVKRDFASELADVQELVDALRQACGITDEEFARIRRAKQQKAGGFGGRFYISTVEVDPDSEWGRYYRAHPERYPEVK